MIISSTEVQNSFGKYLMLAAKEDIIITKNGVKVAFIRACDQYESGAGHGTVIDSSHISENQPAYRLTKNKTTYEAFLKLRNESDERYEYIDGEVYLMASPKVSHQSVLMHLANVFYNFFKDKKCRPFVAPFDIELKRYEQDNNNNMVQPDVMVICDLEEKLGEDDYYHGVPSLVVEIISHSTKSKDFVKKLDLYMSTGVQEYWIVDPTVQEIHVFSFRDREIDRNKTYRENETLESYLFEGLVFQVNVMFR